MGYCLAGLLKTISRQEINVFSRHPALFLSFVVMTRHAQGQRGYRHTPAPHTHHLGLPNTCTEAVSPFRTTVLQTICAKDRLSTCEDMRGRVAHGDDHLLVNGAALLVADVREMCQLALFA